MKKIGCLHAHFSNIEYIEDAFSLLDIELIHFVDPSLMYRVMTDKNFSIENGRKKVQEQLEEITACNVDGILITCTNYISFLPEKLPITVPVIKIDEPYFKSICTITLPQTLVFSNPATVEGTIKRLNEYALSQNIELDLKTLVIDNAFELVMKGLTTAYNNVVFEYLDELVKTENRVLSVSQLSMVHASRKIEERKSTIIINPLDTLVAYMVEEFELKKTITKSM